MKKNTFFSCALLGCILLFLTSCASSYQNAYYGSSNTYMARPYQEDKSHTKLYATAKAGFGQLKPDASPSDKHTNAEGGLHLAHTSKRWYASAGGFGYVGKKSIPNPLSSIPILGGIPIDFVQKPYFGYGGRIAAGANFELPMSELSVGAYYDRWWQKGLLGSFLGSGYSNDFYGERLALQTEYRINPIKLGIQYSLELPNYSERETLYSMHRLTLHKNLGKLVVFGQGAVAKNRQPLLHAGISMRLL
jgi:hypothetical protein